MSSVFSQLKVIKTDRRTCLGENRLDSLVRIATTAPPLSQWDASRVVELWWNDRKRRNVGDVRAPPTKRRRDTDESTSTESASSDLAVTLDDWEDWALSA